MYLVYLALSVIFFIYCSFKYKQAEGKDRRNDRLVRLHGDGNFLASIINKVMGFVWALLGLVAIFTALWAYYMHQRPVTTIDASQEQRVKIEQKTKDSTAELRQEIQVLEKKPVEESSVQGEKTDKVNEAQKEGSAGEKDESQK